MYGRQGIRGLAILAVLLLAAPAMASMDEKITIEFVGFGANPDFYAIAQSDALAGKVLIVYQVGVPTPIASMPLQGTTLKKALASPTIAPYAIGDKGVSGATSPAGFTLVGQGTGAVFHVAITNGTDSVTLGYIPVFTDPTGLLFAAVSIKAVFWTADSSRVVLILNQKLGGEWPMDTDVAAAYALKAG